MIINEKTVLLKNGTECLIRSPGIDDAEAMLDYLRKTSAETDFMIRYPEEVIMSLYEEREFLSDIRSSDKKVMAGAFIGGKLAGNASCYCVADRFKTRHRGEVGISIYKDYWGIGIGTILLNELFTYAPEMGFSQLELGVFSENTRAISLYEKLGFNEQGRIKNACRLKDGGSFDEIIMQKQLEL